MAKFTMGDTEKFFKSLFFAIKMSHYQSTPYQKMHNCNIWGVCFLRKVEFVKNFMRKSGFKIFEITIELSCNLKNLKS